MSYLSKGEIEYLNKKENVPLNQTGILKKRIIDKISSLGSEEIGKAINLLDYKEKKELCKKLVDHFDLKIYNELFIERFELFNSAREGIQLFDKFLSLFHKRVKPYTDMQITSEEYEFIRLNKNDPHQKFRELFSSEQFILRRKRNLDKSFLEKSIRRLELLNLLKQKNVTKLNIFSKTHQEYTLKEFYERGIILSKGVHKEDYIKKSIKITHKGKKINATIIPHPFKAGKNYLNQWVRLNPYYKNINL